MYEQNFDAFTRRAAEGVSRRGTLMTLGGAALTAALTSPLGTEAKENNKKKRKKDRKKEARKAEQKCKQQVADGQSILNSLLDPTPGQLLCCDSLSTCNAALFISCLFIP